MRSDKKIVEDICFSHHTNRETKEIITGMIRSINHTDNRLNKHDIPALAHAFLVHHCGHSSGI